MEHCENVLDVYFQLRTWKSEVEVNFMITFVDDLEMTIEMEFLKTTQVISIPINDGLFIMERETDMV